MNNLKVLVAESDVNVFFAFNQILLNEGCICIHLKSITEAIENINAHKANAAFLDISRSDRDYETMFEQAARELKIPLIIMTSQITDELKNLAWKIGALDICQKPLTLKRVRECLAKINEKINK